jgi:hypothetical protein
VGRATCARGASVIEFMCARLLADGKLRDASLLVVLAYAGLRRQETLAVTGIFRG